MLRDRVAPKDDRRIASNVEEVGTAQMLIAMIRTRRDTLRSNDDRDCRARWIAGGVRDDSADVTETAAHRVPEEPDRERDVGVAGVDSEFAHWCRRNQGKRERRRERGD